MTTQKLLVGTIVGWVVLFFLGYLIFGRDVDDGAVQVSGIIGSVIGAVILLLVYRAVSRRRGGRRPLSA